MWCSGSGGGAAARRGSGGCSAGCAADRRSRTGREGSCSGWSAGFGVVLSGGDAAEVSSAVLRNRAASGPSRMLARLPVGIREDLLRKLPVGVGCEPVRILLQDRHPFHGRLGKTHRFADSRSEDPVAKVLLQQLDRLLR